MCYFITNFCYRPARMPTPGYIDYNVIKYVPDAYLNEAVSETVHCARNNRYAFPKEERFRVFNNISPHYAASILADVPDEDDTDKSSNTLYTVFCKILNLCQAAAIYRHFYIMPKDSSIRRAALSLGIIKEGWVPSKTYIKDVMPLAVAESQKEKDVWEDLMDDEQETLIRKAEYIISQLN